MSVGTALESQAKPQRRVPNEAVANLRLQSRLTTEPIEIAHLGDSYDLVVEIDR